MNQQSPPPQPGPTVYQVTEQESQFGAPQGVYKAYFRRVDQRHSQQYGPGLEWRFEIAEGPYQGKLVSRTTSPSPSPKNACGKILSGLTGRQIAVGENLDISPCFGQLYTVTVEPNSANTGTRVGTFVQRAVFTPGMAMPAANGGPGDARSNGTNGSNGNGTPARFWLTTDGKVRQTERKEVEAAIGRGIDPAKIMLMDLLQTTGWRPSTYFGFGRHAEAVPPAPLAPPPAEEEDAIPF